MPLLGALYHDSSRWVRVTTTQALGPFISQLPSSAITSELLELFTHLASPVALGAGDSDIAYHCAYSLPAVLQAQLLAPDPSLPIDHSQ